MQYSCQKVKVNDGSCEYRAQSLMEENEESSCCGGKFAQYVGQTEGICTKSRDGPWFKTKMLGCANGNVKAETDKIGAHMQYSCQKVKVNDGSCEYRAQSLMEENEESSCCGGK